MDDPLWNLVKMIALCVGNSAWISAKLDENFGFFTNGEVLSLCLFLCITLYIFLSIPNWFQLFHDDPRKWQSTSIFQPSCLLFLLCSVQGLRVCHSSGSHYLSSSKHLVQNVNDLDSNLGSLVCYSLHHKINLFTGFIQL